MKNFITETDSRFIIGDGAMGTMLQNYGLQAGETPENWVLEHPDKLLSIHREYINAGALLIETNTFGGNRIKLRTAGLEDKIKRINTDAVNIAKKAAEGSYVAGSVGPSGKMMEPYGQLNFNEAVEVYREQIEILTEAGVDLILIETMSDLQEIRAAAVAARDINIPLIAQMTFSDNVFTLTGNTPEVAAVVLANLGVDVIGVNCTSGIKNTLEIIKRYSGVTDKPLSIYPNAGKPVLKNGETIYPQSPADFSREVSELLKYNVKIIGGCCGTTPEHIKIMKRRIENISKGELKKNTEIAVDDKGFYLASSRKHIFISAINKFKVFTEDFEQEGRAYIQKMEEGDFDLIYINLDEINYDNIDYNPKLPLVIKCENKKRIEKFLQGYPGRPLLLIPRDRKELAEISRKYGAYTAKINEFTGLYNKINKTKKYIAGLKKE